MKHKLEYATIVLAFLLVSSHQANAGILGKILKACGVKEDSGWMAIANVGDNMINAAAAKTVDSAIDKYAPELKETYNQYVDSWNAQVDQREREYNDKVNQFYSEVDQFKMEYCKTHGFYESWQSQYGESWYETAGRAWFDRQNEAYQRRTGDDLLPWHLRGSAEDNINAPTLSRDEKFQNVVLGCVGLSSSDIDRANRWVENDKYGKEDMVVDAAAEIISGFSPENEELINYLARIGKVNLNYQKDKKTDNAAAISKRNIDMANIVYDAIQSKKERMDERKRALLAEELNIAGTLEEAGFEANSADIDKIAGMIVSIQNNEEMSQSEKQQWYDALCSSKNSKDVDETITNISSMSNDDVESKLNPKNTPSQEEIAAAEKIEKERIRKENAIKTIIDSDVSKYAFDCIDLNDEQKLVLDDIALVLREYDDLSIEIKGHTCSIGTKKANENVGLRRAESAKSYLIEKGISAERISTVSIGKAEPVVNNDTPSNRTLNRRLTFNIK